MKSSTVSLMPRVGDSTGGQLAVKLQAVAAPLRGLGGTWWSATPRLLDCKWYVYGQRDAARVGSEVAVISNAHRWTATSSIAVISRQSVRCIALLVESRDDVVNNRAVGARRKDGVTSLEERRPRCLRHGHCTERARVGGRVSAAASNDVDCSRTERAQVHGAVADHLP